MIKWHLLLIYRFEAVFNSLTDNVFWDSKIPLVYFPVNTAPHRRPLQLPRNRLQSPIAGLLFQNRKVPKKKIPRII
jgi:hypothetical protein